MLHHFLFLKFQSNNTALPLTFLHASPLSLPFTTAFPLSLVTLYALSLSKTFHVSDQTTLLHCATRVTPSLRNISSFLPSSFPPCMYPSAFQYLLRLFRVMCFAACTILPLLHDAQRSLSKHSSTYTNTERHLASTSITNKRLHRRFHAGNLCS